MTAAAYDETPMPAAETPWRQAPLCVLDLETTGLDPRRDEIISFATVPIDGGRAHLDASAYRFVRPARMPEAETIRIHRLRPEDLAGAPTIEDVLDELLAALTGRALIAHVAAVEQGFLEPVLRLAGTRLRNPVIDTAELAVELASRSGRPAGDRISLTALAEDLGLPVHRPHEADGDALTTAQAFLALATRLDAFEPQTVGSLAVAHGAGPLAGVRRALRRIF